MCYHKSFFSLSGLFFFFIAIWCILLLMDAQASMPEAITIFPEDAIGEDTITLTLDLRKICTSEKSLPFTGNEALYITGWIKVLAEGRATWWNGNIHPDPGADGTPSSMTYNGDSTYSIRIKPSTFFHSDGHEIMGFSLNIADLNQQRQAFDYSPFGCSQFYIPLKTAPPVMDTLVPGETLELGGLITENTILDFETIRVVNHVTVDRGVTLTIKPGTTIEFQGHYALDVFGTLIAEGTETEKIFFDASESWAGLWFKNQIDLDTSRIAYCRFENMSTMDEWEGAINVQYYPRLSISYSVITNNTAHSINLTNSDISIDHTVLSDNSKGGLSAYASHASLLNCHIVNNNNHGLFLNLSNPMIINCIINNNEREGLILTAADPTIINSIVASNGEAAINLEISNPRFYNSILWNNQWYISMKDPASTIRFKKCILPDLAGEFRDRGQFPDWEDNYFDIDPMFYEPSWNRGVSFDAVSADWSVPIDSKAVNNGAPEIEGIEMPPFDYDGNERVSYGIIDIGPYEFSQSISSLTFDDDVYDEIIWMVDTVLITQDVRIYDGAKLTIAPGTLVEFQGHHEMIIEGCLIANGAPGHEIRFTIFDTAGFYNLETTEGTWGGLAFRTQPGNPGSEISWCIFEFAADMDGEDRRGGAILIGDDSWPQHIINCLFQHNYAEFQGGAISVSWAGPIIAFNEFRYNRSHEGGAIHTSPTSAGTIRDNYIHHNMAWNWGGGIYTSGAVKIIGNRISYNEAFDQGGGIYIRKSKAIVVRNNIYNNRFGGIAVKNSDPYIANNLIVNNSADGPLGDWDIRREGSGVFIDINSDATVVNNTICNNFSSQYKGSSIRLLSNSKFLNNIVWGNVDDFGNPAPLAIEGVINADIRNNIIMGGPASIRVDNPESSLRIEQIIDSLPQFIQESAGEGISFDGSIADWNINALSPAINNGVFDPEIVGDLVIDYSRNERNQDAWDIGAYEHQTGLLEISSEPKDIVSCRDDSASFKVMANDTAYYQWFLNEDQILGANNPSLTIEKVNQENEGIYFCRIRNAYGERVSEPSFLIVNHPPQIFIQPDHKWMIEGTPAILEVIAEGSPPMEFQWFKDGMQIAEADRPKLHFPDPQSETEGMYYCTIDNSCGTTSTDSIQLFLAPQICMVTIDTTNGSNLVIWEKKSSAPVDSYNVYRESIVAGQYDVLDNVPAKDLSVYADTAADPTVQAYIYKITALDEEGNESDINLCKPHKTIHLLTSLNTEFSVAQLDWDHYYGFTYGTFYIYRSTSNTGFSMIHPKASSTTTWIDKSASSGQKYYYRVAVAKPEPCTPTGEGKKKGTGPYYHSLSNMDDNKIKSTSIHTDTESKSLKIYPNPMQEFTSLRFHNPENHLYKIIIRSISGKIERIIGNVYGNEYTLERGELEPGYYLIDFQGPDCLHGKLIIR